MEQEQNRLKLGAVTPDEHLSDIEHDTPEGDHVRIFAFSQDPDDPESKLATRFTWNRKTGEATTEHGRIRGNVREAGKYVWEHKKPIAEVAAAVASVAVSVTLGTLWARHRKKS